MSTKDARREAAWKSSMQINEERQKNYTRGQMELYRKLFDLPAQEET